MNSRECFCGCGAEIVTANQLAGNLLGWDLTEELGKWMQVTALLEAAAADRDRANEETFIGDGRTMWFSLRDQTHNGTPQTRADRRVTKRWLKFSKRERKKVHKMLNRSGLENPFEEITFKASEIRAWLLMDEWPAWTALPVKRVEEVDAGEPAS